MVAVNGSALNQICEHYNSKLVSLKLFENLQSQSDVKQILLFDTWTPLLVVTWNQLAYTTQTLYPQSTNASEEQNNEAEYVFIIQTSLQTTEPHINIIVWISI